MGKITFVLGGARSGKSRFAVSLAKGRDKSKGVAFVATCSACDKEMKERIALHRKTRPAHWRTFEKPKNIAMLLTKAGSDFDVIIIDCLTLLISDLILRGFKERRIEHDITSMLRALAKIRAKSIVVSNEVGLGIVPNNKMARDFRDIAGRMNQIAAAAADEAYFLVSGLARRIK
ncbi:MAG: bifunctional adenosylcobinamide kinase/adenosylcobinamide-phosphate guanylyltransferase [Candidatus Omnitrophica bacterium]|nr:bifunctional adenosylcobinamide kinase/adenosylcobinamide-phosphate guanylyltransferase [Candidatus Omnitrophota bacterium]MBU4488381.1 bifunctional adenosylcobinamide kinase/adenosylcobinamide-phosphate guanylyltransferase [Candidatus Omnitrophota bacterium]MCG2705016.1 bifunctional adenosylcobinamide kinase/adenosylcobinamide-phosphate guanylyltransferase [Candidatus Omnitrophota bacterium]